MPAPLPREDFTGLLTTASEPGIHTCPAASRAPAPDYIHVIYQGLNCVPRYPNSYVEALTPNTSECSCIWAKRL